MWIWIATGVAFVAWTWMRSSSHTRLLDPRGRLVVVTGCDSGIGLMLALALHNAGCSVLATCLQPDGEGATKLAASGIQVTRLDLRDVSTISSLGQAVATMEDQGQKLWCVVNNAGVLTLARFEWQTTDIILGQLQVNLCGAILVTKTLIPTLKKNKGRIVFVSSPQAILSSPNMAVYCASKSGLESFADGLRREEPAIKVLVVRPFALPMRTGILQNNAQQLRTMQQQMDQNAISEYGPEIKAMEEAFQQCVGKVKSTDEISERLSKCFLSAILSEQPRLFYDIAPVMPVFLLKLLCMLPNFIVDHLVARGTHLSIIDMANPDS
ncbi:unnamed protein product [Meganyctiphanes norvegica]|uniref:Uncharacterized protein n=1 Tax=Meganyctiphanes norvegica TaxID=48144 RepID=A0AAV2Q3Y3_MEGNR